MTPERWIEIQQHLDVALSLSLGERKTFLDSLGTTDAELKREVESFLAGESSDPSFMDTPALDWLRSRSHDARTTPSSMVGQILGAYRVTDLLGIGGMGEVYRAVRVDGEYEQQAAVKLVRPGLVGEFSSVRFRNERQILAKLDHPNIAKILDGGTTADGLSYFVMEFIDGVPITEHCDQHGLSIEDRLRLFRTVCSAVHYAHQHLVVHRDIKPTNILVNPEGIPKLLDFGIAKILNSDLPVAEATITGVWAMTPEYASPEQLRGEPITTATDVYSLGLVLYELLSGQQAHRFPSRMPHEMARVVLESEPDKPSSAVFRKTKPVATQGEVPEKPNSRSLPIDICAARGFSSAKKLHRRLAGDPDNIVLKALRKEPGARYASADQLSEDIRRHLEGLPIAAGKGTTAYRFRKYILRHKAGVASAALIFLTLVTGIVVTLREARVAQRNQLRAEKRFDDVRKLANSLLFDIHDSVKDLPGSTPARKLILQNALQYLDSLSSEAAGDPSLQRELATAYERVAEVQGDYILPNLGETETALRNYQKALALRKSLAASGSATWQDQLALAKSYRLVAAQTRVTGNIPSALENAQQAILICEGLRAAHPQDTQVLAELRTAYERKGHVQRGSWSQASPGDGPAALESFRKAMEIDAVLLKLDPDNEDFQYIAGGDEMYYAEVLPRGSAEKLQHYQHVLEIDEKINQRSPSMPHARGLAEDYNRIGMWYDSVRDHVKSAEAHRHYLEMIEKFYAADPQNTMLKEEVVIGSANLGEQIGFMGKRNEVDKKRESERLLDRAVTLMQSIAEAAPGNASHQGMLAMAHVMRADNFMHWENFKGGLDDYSSAVEIYRRLLAVNPNNTSARLHLLICSIEIAHTKLQMGALQATVELQNVLSDLKPFIEGDKANDEAVYDTAVAYFDLGNVEVRAAREARSSAKKSHWESAARWYGLSLSTLKRVQDLASASENEALGSLDPAEVSRQLATCESAMRATAR
jgi:eukaryotic-like serine/threonine-protein kinase